MIKIKKTFHERMLTVAWQDPARGGSNYKKLVYFSTNIIASRDSHSVTSDEVHFE